MFQVSLSCQVSDKAGVIHDQFYKYTGEGPSEKAIKNAKSDATVAFKFRYGQESTVTFEVKSTREVEKCPMCKGTGYKISIDGTTSTCPGCNGLRLLPVE